MYNEEEITKELYQIIVEKFEHSFDVAEYKYPASLLTENKIEKIEYLLSLNRDDIYWYVWNELIDHVDETEIKSGLMLEMIEHRNRARENYRDEIININEDFNTDRLIVRPFSRLDKFDFTGEKDKDVWEYTVQLFNDDMNLMFSIVEKNSAELAGFIGLKEGEPVLEAPLKSVYTFAYYLRPNFRKKGYMKEVVRAVAKKALSGDFSIMVKSNNTYIREKKGFDCKIIKIVCYEDNLESQNVAKTTGFQLEGIIDTGNEEEGKVMIFSLSKKTDKS